MSDRRLWCRRRCRRPTALPTQRGRCLLLPGVLEHERVGRCTGPRRRQQCGGRKRGHRRWYSSSRGVRWRAPATAAVVTSAVSGSATALTALAYALAAAAPPHSPVASSKRSATTPSAAAGATAATTAAATTIGDNGRRYDSALSGGFKGLTGAAGNSSGGCGAVKEISGRGLCWRRQR